MRTYTVHRPSRAAGDAELEAEQTIFIKEGFCWPALFVPFLWFIYHRMWLVLIGYVISMMFLGALPAILGFSSFIGGAITIVFQAVLAAEANDLRRWTLKRSRFEFVHVVHAPSLFAAEAAYFTQWAEHIASAETKNANNQAQIAFRLDAPPTDPRAPTATPA